MLVMMSVDDCSYDSYDYKSYDYKSVRNTIDICDDFFQTSIQRYNDGSYNHDSYDEFEGNNIV